MRKRALGLILGALLVVGALPARADTHAPGLQFGTFVCNGQVRTMVSPGFNAKAGQDLGSTSVGVVFLITMADTVVYKSPAFGHLRSLTTCTLGDFTFYFLVPPFQS